MLSLFKPKERNLLNVGSGVPFLFLAVISCSYFSGSSSDCGSKGSSCSNNGHRRRSSSTEVVVVVVVVVVVSVAAVVVV